MMSLEAGVLKISGGPNAISREEVSMANLRHRHTEQIQWRYLPKRILTWESTYKTTRQGGRRGSKNPQWFARRQKLIRYDQQESTMICKKAKIDPLQSARIHNDLQEGKNWSAMISKNPQWFARRQNWSATISKQSYNAKQH